MKTNSLFFGGVGVGLFIGAGAENWPISLLGLAGALLCAWTLHFGRPAKTAFDPLARPQDQGESR